MKALACAQDKIFEAFMILLRHNSVCVEQTSVDV